MTLPATHPDAPKGHGASRRTVYAALAGNLAVAITKIVAAVVTGSSAMLSEAIHSIVDTGNEVLLLYGYSQSEKRPNLIHPLGYGRELYFWSFIVALLLFSVGAGVSIYQGVRHVMEPDPVENIRVTYVVLGLSIIAGLLAMESKSLLIGERAPPALVKAICRIAAQQPGVRSANSALTAQLSPNQSLVALSIEFAPTLTVAQVESCVSSIENRVKVMHPDVIALFVKPQTLHQFQSAVRHRFGDAEN
ncbi:TPA: cation transporter [Stenotrophomonas maltophilia]|nr:cation transporter [Stenotrophomonas maltophilia]